jgi:hypothetical protein
MTDQEAFHELCGYTLTHYGAGFIHQLVVDAYTAQNADEHSKPIAVFFAVMGVYLVAERSFTGREVQLAHMALAKRRREWPMLSLPPKRGTLTVHDVLAVPRGEKRDEMIVTWVNSVWAAFAANREAVVTFLRERGIVP